MKTKLNSLILSLVFLGSITICHTPSLAQLTDQEIISMNGFKGAKFGMTKEEVESLPKYETLFKCPVEVHYEYYQNRLYEIRIQSLNKYNETFAEGFFIAMSDLYGIINAKVKRHTKNGDQYNRKVNNILISIDIYGRNSYTNGFSTFRIAKEGVGLRKSMEESREKVDKNKREILGN